MRASEAVYAALRDEIVTWHLPPGAVLSEVEQSTRLGVSRTPLREALSRLAGDGLVSPGKGRTMVVSGLAATDVRKLFELREALETQAARLAARRRDPAVFEALAERFADAPDLLRDDDPDRVAYYRLVAELDEAIDAAIDSPYLRRSLTALRPHVARARRLAHDDPDRLVRAAQEHRSIASAIAHGEETLAVHVTAVHLHASLTTILDAIRASRTAEPVAARVTEGATP